MKVLSSQAVKETYHQYALKCRLTTSVFLSDYSTMDVPIDKMDQFIDHKKREMQLLAAEHLQKHMDLRATRKDTNFEQGTEVRGECYVFTFEELLAMLDFMERKAIDSVTPQTIWGD